MKNELKKEIGAKLRQLRKRLGLTQAEMVSHFNVGRANYSRIEKGEVFPNVAILFTLKKEFNVSLDWLIGGEGEMLTLTEEEARKKRLHWSDSSKEIDELFYHIEKVPMVKHAVLGFFLEYRSKNSQLIEKMVMDDEVRVTAEDSQ